MRSSSLVINRVKNGFLVSENSPHMGIGLQWAFESSTALAQFMKNWGKEHETKTKKEK